MLRGEHDEHQRDRLVARLDNAKTALAEMEAAAAAVAPRDDRRWRGRDDDDDDPELSFWIWELEGAVAEADKRVRNAAGMDRIERNLKELAERGHLTAEELTTEQRGATGGAPPYQHTSILKSPF